MRGELLPGSVSLALEIFVFPLEGMNQVTETLEQNSKEGFLFFHWTLLVSLECCDILILAYEYKKYTLLLKILKLKVLFNSISYI